MRFVLSIVPVAAAMAVVMAVLSVLMQVVGL